MITQHEYDLLLNECKRLPPAKGMYLIDDYIENLLLTVLDFQMLNVNVEKSIGHYRDHRKSEIRNLGDLKSLLSQYADDKEGNTAIAQHLWGNKHWTRVSLLRKLVSFFESIGITSQGALSHWAKTSNFERDFKGRIRGMSYAIYQWLIMRQGIETIKPDIHLRRFAESLVHHSLTDYELVTVLERVAKQLGLKAYQLDWRIWEYQKDRPIVKQSISSKRNIKLVALIKGELEIEIFVDDDTGYLNWVCRNPKGFVVNCERNPRPAYLMLHRADCFMITGRPIRGKVWTRDYVKICALNKKELELWARERVGGELHNCRICNP